MIYVYDILLNFNDFMIPFFEWEDHDDIKMIKKIPLIKVSTPLLKNMYNKNIKFNEEFLESIKNKTVFYDSLTEEKYKYLFLATDTKKVYAFTIKDKIIDQISDTLINEEEEILDLSNSLNEFKIDYSLLNNKNNQTLCLTRKEKEIKEILTKEIQTLKELNNKEKLNYYYFEYFDKEPKNFIEAANELLKSIENLTDKHLKLYEILLISNSK